MKVDITDEEIPNYWGQAAKQLAATISELFDTTYKPKEEEKEEREEKEKEPTPLKCEYNKNFICEPRERIPPYKWDIFACFQCLSDRIISLERKQIQTEHKLMLKMNRH